MRIVYPIKSDKPFFVKDAAGNLHERTQVTKADLAKNTMFFNRRGLPTKIRGRDSSQKNEGLGAIVTNLVGLGNGDLLKRCPRADKCPGGEVKNQSEFGEEGRITRGVFRDQSHCNTCRALAGRKK